MQHSVSDVITGTACDVFHSTGEELRPGIAAPSDFGREVTGFVIDSREATDGSVFIALKGERTDGHEFIASAMANGARYAIVETLPANAPPAGSLLFVTGSPLTALQRLARYWRDKYTLDVIGVTGSVGKTSAKEAIAQSLVSLGQHAIFKTEANLNTEIGVPLELLKLNSRHRAAVIEMGMYQQGDIALLANLARPQVGVVTNVHANHLERTGSITTTARTKAELVHALPLDGLAVLNGDDHYTRAMAVSSPVPSFLFGLDCPGSDFVACNLEGLGRQGFRLCVVHGRRRMEIRIPVPGKHQAWNVLPAVAVAHHLGIEWNTISESLSDLRIGARTTFIPGPNESTIIDDRYNASAASTIAAIDLLREEPGRHFAILGEMYELGNESEREHRKVGAAAAGLDALILIGDQTRWIREGAVENATKAVITTVSNNDEATRTARAMIGPGDVLLIKGSRGLHLEEVVEALTAKPKTETTAVHPL